MKALIGKLSNLNVLAAEIAVIEGGKQNLSIAQIKEVLRCLGAILRSATGEEVMDVMKRLTRK